jgi:hypothetical protein
MPNNNAPDHTTDPFDHNPVPLKSRRRGIIVDDQPNTTDEKRYHRVVGLPDGTLAGWREVKIVECEGSDCRHCRRGLPFHQDREESVHAGR